MKNRAFLLLIIGLKEKNMMLKIQLVLLTVALAFAGCGSDKGKNNEKDSLMTDSAAIDTADMKAAPADTTVMGKDSTGLDTSLVAL
jgi:hypothetical protein